MGTRHLYWILTGPSIAVHGHLCKNMYASGKKPHEVPSRKIREKICEICSHSGSSCYGERQKIIERPKQRQTAVILSVKLEINL
jgi:hypothetical protein